MARDLELDPDAMVEDNLLDAGGGPECENLAAPTQNSPTTFHALIVSPAYLIFYT